MATRFARARSVAPALALALLLAASAGVLAARAQGPGINGVLPTEGGAAIIVWNGGPTESLIAEAWLSGCAVTSLWATAEGRYVGRIQGAPAFVNALWDTSFRGGIPEATPLVVFCAPGGPPAPAPTATPTSTPTPTATPTGTPGATPTGTATAPPDERDCADFETWAEAQAFFEAQGGPEEDPHQLDEDDNGVACEDLPGAP